MTSVLLGNPFSYPVHIASWKRPVGSLDYRVTNSYDGPDYLNGGKHRATDVGNFRQGHTVRAPAVCKATGLKHTDGALGVRFDLGSGVVIELWHLDSTLPIGTTKPVAKGQAVGTTGDTGAKLPDGSSMPAHTHIAGKRAGVPFDVEPYLPMVERPAKPLMLEEDDVKIPTGTALAQGVVGPGNRLRVDPNSVTGSRIIGGEPPTGIGENKPYWVQAYQFDVPGQSYTLNGKPGNMYAWIGVFGQTWYVAQPLVTNLTPSAALPSGDCSAQEATITQLNTKIARARTANDGAQQAQTAVEVALR